MIAMVQVIGSTKDEQCLIFWFLRVQLAQSTQLNNMGLAIRMLS
jgi:hypothetical protein